MIGVVLTESAKIHPIIWVFIIGWVAIGVWAVLHEKKAKKRAKQFDEDLDKRFAGKKVYGAEWLFITLDKELVTRYAWEGMSGYKIFKLDNVKYIMSCWDRTTNKWYIGLYDEKKKGIVGEDHCSRKKKVNKTRATFYGDSEDVEFLEMIMKFVPDAQLVGIYFKEYTGSLKI